MKALLAAAVLAGALAVPAYATPPGPPAPAGSTHFLDHSALLTAAGVTTDQDWYEANVPFLDVPDTQIRDVYHYRWFTWREHLNWLDPVNGYTSSEFLPDVGYNAPGGAIDAAAGHVIHDGRWVRDQSYLDDYESYWLTGPGVGKTHGAYTFWAASSYYDAYLATGDAGYLKPYQQALVDQWNGWANQYDPSLGLYWTTPNDDAMEYDAASYQTNDPYHGGAGFRSSINAYQWADAVAIAKIATMNGDTATASSFTQKAAALKTAMQQRLWDPARQFFYHRQLGATTLLDTREVYGFFPWYFGMPDAADNVAWKQLTDPQGFAATYGPTTTERRAPVFMRDALSGCCHWDGPSWPYATSLVLGGLANVLDDYPAQSYVTKADYATSLHAFAATQYKDGKPYVAEAHHPDQPTWIYDSGGHSLDYNHSSFTDLVVNDLIGIRPQAGTSVTVQPLTPATWDHWALENVPYHGHNLTVLWDQSGSHYGQGAGFKVYVDGALVSSQKQVGTVSVGVGATVAQPRRTVVDTAANVWHAPGGPVPSASYTSPYDDVWRAVDGRNNAHTDPNTRWTSYGTPNTTDWWAVDYKHPVDVSEVRLWFYDDGGGVRVPASYQLQQWTGTAWADVPGQTRTATSPNGLTRVSFPTVATSRLRVVAPGAWGLTEFETWGQPVFSIQNKNSGLLLAVENASGADGARVQQYHDNGTRDHVWQLVRAEAGLYKIKNLGSGKVLGVSGMSTADSAQVVQYADTGTRDHLWQLVSTLDGYYKIKNLNSGLLLGVDGMSTADSANVVQFHDNGTADHLWQLLPTR